MPIRKWLVWAASAAVLILLTCVARTRFVGRASKGPKASSSGDALSDPASTARSAQDRNSGEAADDLSSLSAVQLVERWRQLECRYPLGGAADEHSWPTRFQDELWRRGVTELATVLSLTNEPDWQLRAAGFHLLADWGDDTRQLDAVVVRVLEAGSCEEHPRVLGNVSRCLRVLGSDVAVDALLELATHSSDYVCSQSLTSLGASFSRVAPSDLLQRTRELKWPPRAGGAELIAAEWRTWWSSNQAQLEYSPSQRTFLRTRE